MRIVNARARHGGNYADDDDGGIVVEAGCAISCGGPTSVYHFNIDDYFGGTSDLAMAKIPGQCKWATVETGDRSELERVGGKVLWTNYIGTYPGGIFYRFEAPDGCPSQTPGDYVETINNSGSPIVINGITRTAI